VPEAGSTFILPGMIGRHRAAELLFFGEAFDATTAQRWGLVNAVFPDTEFMECALELLKRLDRIFTDHPVYGSRRLQVALLREEISVGRRCVRGLMKKLGL
jgi:enoyl-CoA hydratase/carnithine racemase